MELNILESSLLSYYKKHTSDYVQSVTMGYIEGNYPVKSLDKLYLAILKSHPHSWGFPDVSAIETAADRFEISDKVSLKNKKELTEHSSSPHIEQLTDDEKSENESLGFDDGKSLLDNIVKKSVETKDVKEVKPNCKICEFKPVGTIKGFVEHKNCIGCGPNKLNFKKE